MCCIQTYWVISSKCIRHAINMSQVRGISCKCPKNVSRPCYCKWAPGQCKWAPCYCKWAGMAWWARGAGGRGGHLWTQCRGVAGVVAGAWWLVFVCLCLVAGVWWLVFGGRWLVAWCWVTGVRWPVFLAFVYCLFP